MILPCDSKQKNRYYKKSTCCNVVWIVVVLSAKPQGLEVLLQEEKQIIPKIQTAINTTFFILFNFTA